MTIIRVVLNNGKSKTIEIDKPYDEIRADDIWAKDIHGIVGWVDVEEEVRQSRKQLYAQRERIDELEAENRQLKYDNTANRMTISRQKANNDKLKANHIEELHELYDLDRKEIDELKAELDEWRSLLLGREIIIKQQKNVLHADSITIIEQMHKIEELRRERDEKQHIIEEQKATITVMSGGKTIADRDRIIASRGKIIERQHKQIRIHCETIGELRADAMDCNKPIDRLERNLHDTNIALDESRKIAREYHKKFTDCEKQLKMEIATVDHLDVMLTEERKGNNDWLWNKYNQLTRMVLESDLTVLGKDQTIARLERRLDKCRTHLSEYDAALKECNELVVEKNRVIDITSAELHNCKFDKGELKADLAEKSVRNNDLIKQYLLDQKEMEKLDYEIEELQRERDEYKEAIKLERIDRAAEKRIVSRCHSNDLREKNTIILEIAKDRNKWRQSTADMGAVMRGLEAELSTCIKYPIDEICAAEDAIEASETEMGL